MIVSSFGLVGLGATQALGVGCDDPEIDCRIRRSSGDQFRRPASDKMPSRLHTALDGYWRREPHNIGE